MTEISRPTTAPALRTAPARALEKARQAVPTPAQVGQDVAALSATARERVDQLKAKGRDMAHADLDHGLHLRAKGFGQEFKLSVDKNGLKNEARVLGVGARLEGDTRGVAAHADSGHSEANVSLDRTGAGASVDTLGMRAEGKAGTQGVSGDVKPSANGIAVPIALGGDEVLLEKDGDLEVKAMGVKAGVNVKNGSGAHAGFHRFGVGVDLSREDGLTGHVGRHTIGK